MMVNLKLSEEIRNDVINMYEHGTKKKSPPTGIESIYDLPYTELKI